MEEDDEGEGSGVCVRGNEKAELEVELQKKNVWFVFLYVGACYKIEEGMNFFFFFLICGIENAFIPIGLTQILNLSLFN